MKKKALIGCKYDINRIIIFTSVLIGFGFGLFLPFFIKKYFNTFLMNIKNIDELIKNWKQKTYKM